MTRKIHTFDNGVQLYDDHLMPIQRERYALNNVHEADEEAVFTALIHTLPSDAVFVNVGAAVGYYLILAKKIAPTLTIHAVEPLEKHRHFLTENLVLNNMDPATITLHHEGIAAQSGETRFEVMGYGSHLHRPQTSVRRRTMNILKRLLNRTTTQPARDRTFITIPIITLEQLVQRIDRSVDLLQMDVQGLEAEVLMGASHTLQTGAVKIFLIGTHGDIVHDQCVEILQKYSYTLTHSQPHTRHQPDGILVAEKE